MKEKGQEASHLLQPNEVGKKLVLHEKKGNKCHQSAEVLSHSTKPGTEEEPLLSPRLTPAAACTVPADRGREEQASKGRGRT